MRVLVTGGGGYIGSVAVEVLQGRGYEVVALDNFENGHRQSIPGSVDCLDIDLRDPEAVDAGVSTSRPEAVMHFGALTIVPESIAKPNEYFAANTFGSHNLLTAMLRRDIGKFVFSSTAAVYGMPARSPVEEDDPKVPISPYGSSKLMVEEMAEAYARAYGLRYAAMRYFNVAGATELHGEDHHPESHLIPSAISAALGRREALQLFGTDYDTPDGTAIRDYVHVVDLVEAHIAALERLEAIDGPINLGAGHGASVKEILASVQRVSGRQVPVVEQDRRAGDPPELVASIERAKSVLDWEPSKSKIDTIVESAWRWHTRFPEGYGDK